MTNLSPLPHFPRGKVPGTIETVRCMGHTAGLSRFGEEREGDLRAKLYVEINSRKVFCNTVYRRTALANCYPEARLSFFLSSPRQNHKTIPRMET